MSIRSQTVRLLRHLEKMCSRIIQKNLDDIITIEDDELIVAFLDMVENHKMIVENSGLLTVAALKHLDVKDKKVVSILSGGNMDVITMSSVVQHRSDPERPYLYRICSASGQSQVSWFVWQPLLQMNREMSSNWITISL